MSQLQKDLDAVKSEIDKAKQAKKKDAEAKTKALEQENASLKDQVKTLEQENAGLKANAEKTASQLGNDITAARNERRKLNRRGRMQKPRSKRWNRKMLICGRRAHLGFLKK